MLRKVYVSGFVFFAFMTLATIGGLETSRISLWLGIVRIVWNALAAVVFLVLGDLLDLDLKKALPEVGTSDKAVVKNNRIIVAYKERVDNGK